MVSDKECHGTTLRLDENIPRMNLSINKVPFSISTANSKTMQNQTLT